ncbi:MAG TPA: helix-turn-helix domain-containing protein [Bryobacteraceae bacterium]
MESVGEILRTERLRQGLSLDALSAKTRIPLKSLVAIEKDDPSEMSSAFFYKSFVRQFAARLGLNYSDLKPALETIVAEIAEPAFHHTITDPMLPKIAPLEPLQPKRFRGLVSMVALFIVLFACSGLYAMWQDAKSNAPALTSSRTVDLHRSAN